MEQQKLPTDPKGIIAFNKAARALFREQADFWKQRVEKISARNGNAYSQRLLAISYEGLASNNWTHEILYPDVGRRLADISPLQAEMLAVMAKRAGGKIDSASVPINDKEQLLSQLDMYYRGMKAPGYYPKTCFHATQRANYDGYSDATTKHKIVVDFFVGNGNSVRDFYGPIQGMTAIKEHYMCDLVSFKGNEDFKRNMEEAGIPLGKITTHIGNIHGEDFWKSRMIEALRRDAAPAAFKMDDSTPSDFGLDLWAKFFINAKRECKPGTDFYLGMDGTDDRETLEYAYANEETLQWLYWAFMMMHAHVGMQLKPETIEAHVNVKHYHGYTPIVPFMRCSEQQVFTVGKDKDKKPIKYIVPAGDILGNDVRKTRPEEVQKMLRQVGMEIVRVMNYDGSAGFPKAKPYIIHMRTPPKLLKFKAA